MPIDFATIFAIDRQQVWQACLPPCHDADILLDAATRYDFRYFRYDIAYSPMLRLFLFSFIISP